MTKVTIALRQVWNQKYAGPHDTENRRYNYLVTKLTNTVEWDIGHRFETAEVEALIARGFTVTVVDPS